MTRNLFRRVALIVGTTAISSALIGCSSSLVGTYAGPGGLVVIELKSGGQATFKSALGDANKCTWSPNGKAIKMTCDNQTVDISVNDDGSLMAPVFGNLTKSK